MKKKLIPVIILVLIAGYLVYDYLAPDYYEGMMEATVVANVAEVSGKILEMPIELGQEVKAGDTIAVIDSTNQAYAVEQLEIGLEKAMLALGQSIGGSGTTAGNALLNAQAVYNSAVSAATQAQKDYEGIKTLFESGAVSGDKLDKARLVAQTAMNAVDVAKAQLSNAENDYSEETAGLEVSLIQSRLAQARELLDKYIITAACDGIIMSKSYSRGSVVAASADLADIAAVNESYLVFYLPIDEITRISYGDQVTVKYLDGEYVGTIKYIDVKASYTPKDLQTPANKDKKSVKVKLSLPEECGIKPGETATITSLDEL